MEDFSACRWLLQTLSAFDADIYEWGWGTSFHFSPLLPGKSIPASEAAHEARIAALLGLKVGRQPRRLAHQQHIAWRNRDALSSRARRRLQGCTTCGA